jgi:hypothetical protein
VRIDQNTIGFETFRTRTRDAETAERAQQRAVGDDQSSATSATDTADTGSRAVLDRVAAENAAASLSRIRDAELANQLASLTAASMRSDAAQTVATQANLSPQTVAALLQS